MFFIVFLSQCLRKVFITEHMIALKNFFLKSAFLATLYPYMNTLDLYYAKLDPHIYTLELRLGL